MTPTTEKVRKAAERVRSVGTVEGNSTASIAAAQCMAGWRDALLLADYALATTTPVPKSPTPEATDAEETLWRMVREELQRARRKFPDARYTLTAATEEHGELARAILRLVDERKPTQVLCDSALVECVQALTTLVRVATEGDSSLGLRALLGGADAAPALESPTPVSLHASPAPEWQTWTEPNPTSSEPERSTVGFTPTHEHFKDRLFQELHRGRWSGRKMVARAADVVVYRNERGDVWVREAKDFDGLAMGGSKPRYRTLLRGTEE